ncbi:MAG: AraC family transcriptional regulator [Anaerolineae bacterium]|nr:AraC family transcriptional regulator [Anaerolineae bacterium]
MAQEDLNNRVSIMHFPRFHNLEWLHARYTTQNFTRHSHEQFALGMIEAGALEFNYRGETLIAPTGTVNLCLPGEVHNGHAVENSWTYRMFYFDPVLLQQMACMMAEKQVPLPFIKNGVLNDPYLAALVQQFHRLLKSGPTAALEREHYFDRILSRLISRHAYQPAQFSPPGDEHNAVLLIRNYIDNHYNSDINSDDLSRETNLSRFHLNRVFSQATGIPPYAYLRQVRIRQAKKLLAQGESIANTAALTGFTDQSHLNRWFKRLCGFTPGEYSNGVQYT